MRGCLEDVEKRVVRRERRTENEEERKEELGRKEVRRVIKNIKDRKAMGKDGMPRKSGNMGGRDGKVDMEFLQQSMEERGMAGRVEGRGNSVGC